MKFKLGDRVKVVKVLGASLPSVRRYIGKTGTVNEVNGGEMFPYLVLFSARDDEYFRAVELAKVGKPKPKKKPK